MFWLHFLQMAMVDNKYLGTEATTYFDCENAGALAIGVSKFPDPNNCQQGFYCVNQKAFLLVCPPFTIFDRQKLDCDLPQNKVDGNCNANDADAQAYVVEPSSPYGVKVNDCSLRLSGNYPLAYGDCTRYVQCTHGKATVKKCHWNLLFDTETNDCHTSSKAHCWAPSASDNSSHSQNRVIVATIFGESGVHVKDKASPVTPAVGFGHDHKGKSGSIASNGHDTASTANVHTHGSAKTGNLVMHEQDKHKPKTECHYHARVSVLQFERVQHGIVITSQGHRNDGMWQNWLECSPGKYINGLSAYRRSKVMDQVADNAGIISVSFQCQSPNHMGVASAAKDELPFVAPGAPPTDLGFYKYYTCQEGGVGIGFQINGAKNAEKNDNIATANLKILCSCGPPAVKPYWENDFQAESRIHGEWLPERYCQPRQAICGVNTQMQDYVDKITLKEYDNTGMNNVKIKCCDVPNPALTCHPVEKGIHIALCNNTGSDETRPCEFDSIIGTAYDYSKGERIINFYESIGYTRGFLMKTLKDRLTTIKCPNGECLFSWSNATASVWKDDERTVRKLQIPPHWTSDIFQVVGECGHYVIHTNRFMRHDFNSRHNRYTKEYFELF